MLKDKQTFKVTRESAASILNDVNVMEGATDSATMFALCYLSLDKFFTRLLVIENTRLHLKAKKVSLNKKEQIAFHIAVKQGHLSAENIYIQEIFTAIDRTL